MDETEWQSTWHSLREILGSKWSLHVLRLLSTRSYGFNELKREVDGMTATMLSRRLKQLACHGFVDRSVAETTPPATTYRLTPAGAAFARRLAEMEDLVDTTDCAGGDGCGDCDGETSESACVGGGPEKGCLTVTPT